MKQKFGAQDKNTTVHWKIKKYLDKERSSQHLTWRCATNFIYNSSSFLDKFW